MPYQSDRQRRFMHARHPHIAAKWDEEIRQARRRRVRKSRYDPMGEWLKSSPRFRAKQSAPKPVPAPTPAPAAAPAAAAAPRKTRKPLSGRDLAIGTGIGAAGVTAMSYRRRQAAYGYPVYKRAWVPGAVVGGGAGAAAERKGNGGRKGTGWNGAAIGAVYGGLGAHGGKQVARMSGKSIERAKVKGSLEALEEMANAGVHGDLAPVRAAGAFNNAAQASLRRSGRIGAAAGGGAGTALGSGLGYLEGRNNRRVGKAADWKTIDQRERVQIRARRQQRQGLAAAAIGGGAVLAAHRARPGSLRRAKEVAAYMSGMGRAKGPWGNVKSSEFPVGLRARYTADEIKRNPELGAIYGGTALGAGGVGWAATGRGREAYQQHKINDRRRANAAARRQKVGKALSWGDGGTVGRKIVEKAQAPGMPKVLKPITPITPGGPKKAPTLARTSGQAGRGTPPSATAIKPIKPRPIGKAHGPKPLPKKARIEGRNLVARHQVRDPFNPISRTTDSVQALTRYGDKASRNGVGGLYSHNPRLANAHADRSKLRDFGKAARRHDPEDARRTRLGMYTGAAALGGAYVGGSGLNDIYRDTKYRARRSKTRAFVVKPKAGAKVAGGVGLYGVASHAYRKTKEPRWQ